MPATILFAEDFSGIADGVDITTSNSGFNTVTPNTNTIKAQTSNGRKCAEFTMNATATAAVLQRLGLGSLTVPVFYRFYLERDDVTATWFDMLRGLDSAATRAFNVGLTTAELVRIGDAADAAQGTLAGTVQIPTSWTRFEAKVTPSTTVGRVEWRAWWNRPDAPIEEAPPGDFNATATNLALLATLDGGRLGVTSTPTNQNGKIFRIAQFAMGVDDWLGPAQPETRTVDYSCFPKYELRTDYPGKIA